MLGYEFVEVTGDLLERFGRLRGAGKYYRPFERGDDRRRQRLGCSAINAVFTEPVGEQLTPLREHIGCGAGRLGGFIATERRRHDWAATFEVGTDQDFAPHAGERPDGIPLLDTATQQSCQLIAR